MKTWQIITLLCFVSSNVFLLLSFITEHNWLSIIWFCGMIGSGLFGYCASSIEDENKLELHNSKSVEVEK